MFKCSHYSTFKRCSRQAELPVAAPVEHIQTRAGCPSSKHCPWQDSKWAWVHLGPYGSVRVHAGPLGSTCGSTRVHAGPLHGPLTAQVSDGLAGQSDYQSGSLDHGSLATLDTSAVQYTKCATRTCVLAARLLRPLGPLHGPRDRATHYTSEYTSAATSSTCSCRDTPTW